MMGGRRTGDLLLGQDSERPLVNRLTFILSFFMLTTGYVFYYSFYGCPFELKSLKLENNIEEEVKEKTFYENLLTIIYGEDRDGQAVTKEPKKWSALVSEWWSNFSGDETKSVDFDDLELVKEIPYNNSIKVLFQSILQKDTKNINSMGETDIKPIQTNESLKESEPEQTWSLLSFNFASAATLPQPNTETEEGEQLNFFDLIENDENIEEEEESAGNVLNIFQCDKVTENNECQAQIIKAAE